MKRCPECYAYGGHFPWCVNSALPRECQECGKYGGHEPWCDKTK